MKISYIGWGEKYGPKEIGGKGAWLENELVDVYEQLIKQNEQNKKKLLHDNLLKIKSLDWDIDMAKFKQKELIRLLNES